MYKLLALFAFNSRGSRYARGFTLIEVALSVGVIVLITIGGLAFYINSRNIRDLATSGQNVLSI